MSDQYKNILRGPRDVYALEAIRQPVVETLAGIGMSDELIVDLLGIEDGDVVRSIVTVAAKNHGAPDQLQALLEWAKQQAYRDEKMSQRYAAACGQTLAEFEDLLVKRPDVAADRLVYRVSHEIRQALALWLNIKSFLETSETRRQYLESFLRPAHEDDEAERRLAGIVFLAFREELHLPHDRLPTLWREAVELACAQGLKYSPGSNLAMHLSYTEWQIIKHTIRPYFAPMWPEGAGERVRQALRSHAWEGADANEVRWLCDGPELDRVYREAYEVYRQAEGRGDTETMDRVREDVRQKERVCHALSMSLQRDHEQRHATHLRIAAWLAEHHHELIELVRPCGNPLGAQWPNLSP